MRYQKASDDVPLSNGRKPILKTCKDDDPYPDDSTTLADHIHAEAKSLKGRHCSGSGSATQSPARDFHLQRVPSPSDSPAAGLSRNLPLASVSPNNSNSHEETNEVSQTGSGGGDVLLQWGHNKRSRRSRTEGRSPVAAGGIDEPSARPRQGGKIRRRSAIAASEKVAAVAAEMLPPGGSYNRGGGLRPSAPLRDATSSLINNGRAVEERHSVVTRSEKRPPASSPEKTQRKPFANGSGGGIAVEGPTHPESKQQHQAAAGGAVHEPGGGWTVAGGGGEKLRLDRFEWPRIYVSLSRKEKEDDFLAMKGTKLPQRPKKRAKNVDKALQYCFPGMWLSDLTRGRYEVREKKCAKKKRRGLKGMENMDSDSE